MREATEKVEQEIAARKEGREANPAFFERQKDFMTLRKYGLTTEQIFEDQVRRGLLSQEELDKL